MKKVKPEWKMIMIDGYVQKVGSFVVGDANIDDVTAVRSWMNDMRQFVSIGDNHIINLRYVKRIKRIWRLRDHLPKLKLRLWHILVYFVLWLILSGYLILIA